jgi:hypothetical protein
MRTAKPLTHILPMKNWSAAKRCWVGTVCQVVRYDDGTEGIVVFDAMNAKTEQALDDELRLSMTTRPRLKNAEDLWGGPIKEPEHMPRW